MDITEGKAAIRSGADTLEGAVHKVKHGVQYTGQEVNSFVHRRPVETALLSAAGACLITGLAFWFTRPD
ncbi:MAG: hypothetical protein ACREPK_06635 [Rhodanobacteraceae bacterium]